MPNTLTKQMSSINVQQMLWTDAIATKYLYIPIRCITSISNTGNTITFL